MHHFFVKNNDIEGESIRLSGPDRHHAEDVLRLRIGEEVLISDEDGRDYRCSLASSDEESLIFEISERLEPDHDLPSQVWLSQGLPKSDKMEFIIQKATELGVSHIVPVSTKNTVVQLDEKKAARKLRRWQAIAEAAAKQSKRSRIPKVHEPMSFRRAAELAGEFEVSVIPYEDEHGIESLCEAIVGFIPGRRIGVIIGPEGGFDPLEVRYAKSRGVLPVSLGKRILRTETAAIVMLSMVMIRLEISEGVFSEEG